METLSCAGAAGSMELFDISGILRKRNSLLNDDMILEIENEY